MDIKVRKFKGSSTTRRSIEKQSAGEITKRNRHFYSMTVHILGTNTEWKRDKVRLDKVSLISDSSWIGQTLKVSQKFLEGNVN